MPHNSSLSLAETVAVLNAPVLDDVPSRPSIALRTVTPAVASEWLRSNGHNRAVSRNLVDSYARDMLAGRWVVNGEAIQIGTDGTLLNGQHRLSAVVEAGVEVEMLVVSGLPMEAQDTIDTGRKRAVGDVLAIHGVARGPSLAAVARISFFVRHGMSYKPTDSEVRTLVENDHVLQWIASDVVPELPTDLIPIALAIYAYRRFHAVDAEACAEFFSKLKALDNLAADSPILVLHRRLSSLDKKSRSASWRSRAHLLALVFITWNAWRSGETRQRIVARPDAKGVALIPDPV